MSKSCEDACGCDATPAEGNTGSWASEASGNWISVYTVPKMDCPSEERMIRLALNGFEDIRGLSFELSDRQLKVVAAGEVIAESIIASNSVSDDEWLDVTVDLTKFAGRKIELSIENCPNDWHNEWAYWNRVSIVSE